MSIKHKVSEVVEITRMLKAASMQGNLTVSDDQLMQTANEIIKNESADRLNQIIQLAFAASDSGPSALEAIAMQLGFKWKEQTLTISESLSMIADQMDTSR